MASFEKPNSSDKFLARLPDRLKQFIVPQNYAQYTAMDQAVWRFVMRKNTAFLKTVAHESYCNGLEQAGISIDTIPNIYGMNRILKKLVGLQLQWMVLFLQMRLWNFRPIKSWLLLQIFGN